MSWRSRAQLIKSLRAISSLPERRAYTAAALAPSPPPPSSSSSTASTHSSPISNAPPPKSEPGPSTYYSAADPSSSPSPPPELHFPPPPRHPSETWPETFPDFSLDSIPPHEHENVQLLWNAIQVPEHIRLQNPKSDWHDRVWARFHVLSPYTRRQLPVPFLREVLHRAVPDRDHLRVWLPKAIKRVVAADHQDLNAVIYPWETRLQAVISSMMASVQRRIKAGGPSPDQGAPNDCEGEEEEQVMPEDYIFILTQFAHAGYITGVEAVVPEIRSRGFPISDEVQQLRLRSLSQWITVRTRLRRRWQFLASPNPQKHSRSYGENVRLCAQFPTLFPPDVAALLKELLDALRQEGVSDYRSQTLGLLLRIAKETGNLDAMAKILLGGYGVDLRFTNLEHIPIAAETDAQPATVERDDQEINDAMADLKASEEALASGSTSTRKASASSLFDRRPQRSRQRASSFALVDANVLNTVLDGLGEKGNIWKMLSVFEVLGLVRERSFARDHAGRRMDSDYFTPADPPEEPPRDLSEAIKREEESRPGLISFGSKATSKPKGAVAQPPAGSETPSKTGSSFHDFLSAQPTIAEAVSDVAGHVRKGEGIDFTRTRLGLSTSASYAIAIHHACVYGASLTKDNRTHMDARKIELGLYFLRCAVRRQIEQHTRFVREWVWIREMERAALSGLAKDPAGEYVDETEAQAIAEWRAMRNRAIVPPSVTVTEEMVAPLFAVVYMAASRGRTAGWVGEISAELERAAVQLRDELAVILGPKFAAYEANEEQLTLPDHPMPGGLPGLAWDIGLSAPTALSSADLLAFGTPSVAPFSLTSHMKNLRSSLAGLKKRIAREAERESHYQDRKTRMNQASIRNRRARAEAEAAKEQAYSEARAREDLEARERAQEREALRRQRREKDFGQDDQH